MNEDKPRDGDDSLEQTKRIMERLVRTPPKPHKEKGGGKADQPSHKPSKGSRSKASES